MAGYNNYFPMSYQPMYQQPMQMQPQPQPQTQGNNINWVQGEAAARSFAVAPGQSVLLLDSDASVFYIKSSDASGMPLPLRIFDYTERTHQNVSQPQIQNTQPEYITREEFEKRISELMQVDAQTKVTPVSTRKKGE